MTEQPTDDLARVIEQSIFRGHQVAVSAAWLRVLVVLVLSVGLLAGTLAIRAAVGPATVVPGQAVGTSSLTPESPVESIVDTTTVTATDNDVAAPGTPENVQVSFDDDYKRTEIIVGWSKPNGGGPIDRCVVLKDEVAVDPTDWKAGAVEQRIPNGGGIHAYTVQCHGPGGTGPTSGAVIFPGQPPTPIITSAVAVTRPEGGWDITVEWDVTTNSANPVTGFDVLLNDAQLGNAFGDARAITFAADQLGVVQVTATGPGGRASSDPTEVTKSQTEIPSTASQSIESQPTGPESESPSNDPSTPAPSASTG